MRCDPIVPTNRCAVYPNRCAVYLFAFATIVAAMVGSGCSESVDPGDVAAFCDLVSTGAVPTSSDADPTALAALQAVAPPDIRPTIARLQESASRLGELADDDLDGLFAAQFNPDALDAQEELETYATATCGAQPGEQATVDPQIAKQLNDYLALSAAGQRWLESIQVIPTSVDGHAQSVRVVFVSEPEDGEAEEVCVNVSGWLYGAVGGTGAVTVDYRGAILAQRVGPEGTCAVPGD